MCGRKKDKKPKKERKVEQVGRKLDPDNANTAIQNTDEERRAMAAEALEKRLNQGNSGIMLHSSKNIYEQAKRQLMEEQQREAMNPIAEKEGEVKQPTEKSTVLYTCDLLGDDVALPKAHLQEAIEKHIRQKMSEEPLQYSVLLMNFLNPAAKKDVAVETIKKYLENVLSDLNELKFRRIKTSNKVFMEKVAPVDGAVDFLKAVGFEEQQSRNEQTGELDSFLVLDEPNSSLIQYSLMTLGDEMSVKFSLYRDSKVFAFNPNDPIQEPAVPDSFYELSPEELKAMQMSRSEELDKSTTLRTQKMRQEDTKPKVVYNRCSIRIRFPDNYILQGEFRPHETVCDLRAFVKKSLQNSTEAFDLCVPGRELLSDSGKTLAECGLVPLATLHFVWKDGQSQDMRSEYLALQLKDRSTRLTQE